LSSSHMTSPLLSTPTELFPCATGGSSATYDARTTISPR
jgi:hypothetical protein